MSKRLKEIHPENILTKNCILYLDLGGRRLCAGETFARNTMFLCATTILQNFNLKSTSDKTPGIDDTVCGLIRIPNDFWVKLEAR